MIFAVAFDDELIVVEPFFHPANVYPDLVGSHNVHHVISYVPVFVEHPEPPVLLYVNV